MDIEKNKAGEEDEMEEKKATVQNCKHGSNKYTNGSHGYLRVFFVFVLFPAEM